MKEYKLNIDRKMPADAEIEKHKNFADLLAKMPQTPPPQAAKPSFFQKYGMYIVGAAVALMGVGIWASQKEEKNNTPQTIVADTIQNQAVTVEEKQETPPITKQQTSPIVVEKPAISPTQAEANKNKKPEKVVEQVTKQTEELPAKEPIKTKVEKTATPTLIEPQKPTGKTLAFKTDVSKFPELSVYQGVQWEYVGTSDEDNPYKNGVLNVKNVWKSVEIQKKDAKTYLVVLSDKEGKTFSFPAKPVFKGQDYEEAMKVYLEKHATLDSKTWD